MKTITLKSPDSKTTFELHIYKSGESVEIFKGATGIFGKAAGDKTPGLVYVVKGTGHVSAQDQNIDREETWNWIQEWMQKGMDAELKLEAAHKALDRIRLYGHSKNPADDIAQLQLIATETVEALRK